MYLTAGGVAGFCFSFLTYPIDTFKTNLQAGDHWRQAMKKAADLRSMKGLEVATLRGVVINAAGFLMYEKVQELSKNLDSLHYSMY